MISGLHLLLFQGVAWVKMYRDLIQIMPRDVAMEIIVENKEICGICQWASSTLTSTENGYRGMVLKFSKLLPPSFKPLKVHLKPLPWLIYTLIDPSFNQTSVVHIPDSPPPKFFM